MQVNPLDQIRSTLVIIAFCGVFFVLMGGIYDLLGVSSAEGGNWTQGEAFTRDNLIGLLSYGLLGVLLWLLTYRQRDELAQLVFAIPNPDQVRDYLWLGVPMLLSAMTFSYVLFYPLSLIAPDWVQSWLLDAPYLLYWDEEGSYLLANLVGVFMAIVMAPVIEEYLFRGYLLNRWTLKFGAWPATLLSSFVFAILHVDMLGAFVFAVFLCLLYMKTRSLIGPMLVHFSNNALSVLLEWMDRAWWSGFERASLQDFYDQWWLGLIGLVVGVPWLWRYAQQHFFPLPHLLAVHEKGGDDGEAKLVG